MTPCSWRFTSAIHRKHEKARLFLDIKCGHFPRCLFTRLFSKLRVVCNYPIRTSLCYRRSTDFGAVVNKEATRTSLQANLSWRKPKDVPQTWTISGTLIQERNSQRLRSKEQKSVGYIWFDAPPNKTRRHHPETHHLLHINLLRPFLSTNNGGSLESPRRCQHVKSKYSAALFVWEMRRSGSPETSHLVLLLLKRRIHWVSREMS